MEKIIVNILENNQNTMEICGVIWPLRNERNTVQTERLGGKLLFFYN